MINQIFVIGRNRSGTKWLSNILANHSKVAAVQRKGADGILESNLLSTYPKNFDLSNIEERTAFEILFKKSNFHICSKIKGQVLSSNDYKNYYDFFTQYMDEIAVDRNAEFWLQKTSSDQLPNIYREFPRAKILIIRRENVFENVISKVTLSGLNINFLSLIPAVLGYWRDVKTENNYRGKPNVFFLTYESLKAENEKMIRQACEFLNITFEKDMLEVRFLPNTSYTKIDKSQLSTKSNILKVKFLSMAIKFVPLLFLDSLVKMKNFVNRGHNPMFIKKSFEEYRKKIKRYEDSHTSQKG